jgi:acetylglutamate kinase
VELGQAFARDIALLKQSKVNPIVVHGGGPQIAAMLKNLGIESKFEGGLRVTDRGPMEVVEMVLAGSINKEIVALINAEGEWAIGLCGKDGNMVFAREGQQDVQGSRLQYRAGARPRFRRRAGGSRPHAARPARPLRDDPGHRAGGARAATATPTTSTPIPSPAPSPARSAAKRLLFLTDVPGVLDKNKKLIDELSVREAKRADRRRHDQSGGMIPKVETCLEALDNGVEGVVILNGKTAHVVLVELFTEHGAGTLLVR